MMILHETQSSPFLRVFDFMKFPFSHKTLLTAQLYTQKHQYSLFFAVGDQPKDVSFSKTLKAVFRWKN